MMKSKECGGGAAARRAFVGNAVIAVVFIGFASLAVAAALYRSAGDPALDQRPLTAGG